ncbi:restriction endonuclease subunit S [Acinetobacter pseudolwoffii]|uniref:Restriction endonuclease subunit S n=2 Tax=Acinetobacter pseudolwoffii TaxID=2053287 RepID=A0A2H9YNZ4_9GAMM|nr:restriction endonuclease subunit S [Acinetobacter pseudolwoffii]PJO74361.1 restriction endonuclease subunit S [Acinetobacter pseudolwoffii]
MAAPKLRFKEFDGDWCFRKIGDISECIVPGRNKPKLFDGDIPWVTTPDLKDKTYVSDTRSNYYISEEEAKSVGSKIVPTNSVIMSCVGDLGLFAINTKPIVINQQLHAFILDDHKYSSIFVLNALSKNQDYIERVATKTALPYLNKDNCNSIPLFLCSFKEQTKIASFLSNVDEKISQLTKKHELLSQYKQGMMQKLFSQQLRFKADDGSEFEKWEKIILNDVSDVRDGTHDSPKYVRDGYALITSKNLKNGKLDFSDINYISRQDFESINKRSKVDIGDIIFGMIGTIGNPVLLKTDNFAIKNVALIKQKKELLNTFLIQYLNTDLFEKQVRILNAGNTQKFLALGQIRSLNILKPCLAEQTKIANFLSAIDQKIEVVVQQIEQAKQWKKGLLQQMFV